MAAPADRPSLCPGLMAPWPGRWRQSWPMVVAQGLEVGAGGPGLLLTTWCPGGTRPGPWRQPRRSRQWLALAAQGRCRDPADAAAAAAAGADGAHFLRGSIRTRWTCRCAPIRPCAAASWSGQEKTTLVQAVLGGKAQGRGSWRQPVALILAHMAYGRARWHPWLWPVLGGSSRAIEKSPGPVAVLLWPRGGPWSAALGPGLARFRAGAAGCPVPITQVAPALALALVLVLVLVLVAQILQA